MFIFKNAWISITRNKGRNILIGVIILVIACACTVTFAINNTAKDLINSYKSAYDKELTISFNRQNMMKDFDFSNRDNMDSMKEKFNNVSSYTISDVEKFAESDHIESYYYTYSVSLNGNNIENADSETESNSSGRANMPNMPGGGKDFKESSYNPKMIVADEPTGNLDKQIEKEILDIFQKLAHEEGKCVIIVTHSSNVCDMVDQVYDLKKVK